MPALSRVVKEETIREHAYYLWERDGRPHGRDHEFWDRATAELTVLTKRASPTAAKPAKAAKPKAVEPKAAAKVEAPKVRTSAAKVKPEAKPKAKAL